METGVIGYSLAGKTTIYNALTGQSAETSMHSGGKKQFNIAEIPVPDDRVEILTKMFNPKRTVYTTVVFKDIQVEFNEDKGITPASIADMRNAGALTLVIRAFEDEAVAHPFGKVDPVADLKRFIDALVFSDYAVSEKRLERLAKEAKKTTLEYKTLERINEKLLEGDLIGKDFLTEDETKLLSGFCFLTAKPVFVVANTGEDKMDITALEKAAAELKLPFFAIRGDTEMEIAQLPPEDQKEFLADLGIEEAASRRFIRAIYENLNLITFLTVGEDEVRSWSVEAGSSAPRAAGKIHSDLEKGFIRAEVVSYTDLLEAGNMAGVKKSGKLRLEGKGYIVQDGDILNIRFNV